MLNCLSTVVRRVLVTGIAAVAGCIGAEEPSRPVSFEGSVEVNVVNLYVTVLDSTGTPVPTLKPEDFVIIEDGEPRRISNFSVISSTAHGTPTIGEPDGAAARQQNPPAPTPLSVALLFDTTSLLERDKARVSDALTAYLEADATLAAEYLVAVSNPELKLVGTFTDDRAELAATVAQVMGSELAGAATLSSRRALRSEVGSAGVNLNEGRRLQYRIEAFNRQETDRITRGLASLESLVRAMSGRGGRKVVLWVSSDVALQPGVDVYAEYFNNFSILSRQLNLDPPDLWGVDSDLTRRFQAVAGSAQAAGVTIMAIDARDRDSEQFDVATRVRDVNARVASEFGGVPTNPSMLKEAIDATSGAGFLAQATGGRLFANSRNFPRFFTDLRDELGSCYFIGYERPVRPDGELHSVQVRVPGNSYTVRHHEKLLDRTTQQRLADLARSRLQLDSGSNPLGIELGHDIADPEDDGTMILPLVVVFPVNALTFVSEGANRVSNISLTSLATDDEGHLSPARTQRLTLRLTEEQLSSGVSTGASIQLQLSERTTAVAVAVRDEISGIEATARLDLSDLL